MNFLAMAQRLHRESGRSGDGPTSIIGASKEYMRLFDWIADAWRELQVRPIDWKWMRRQLVGYTTTTQVAYSGADLGAVDFGRWNIGADDYGVRAFDPASPTVSWPVWPMAYAQFREQYIDATPQAGRPLDYSISDTGQLMIGPLSDLVYGIKTDYLAAPTELLADTDTPDMPAEFHMMLVWRALVEVGKYDNAPDVLARGSENFARMEQSLISSQSRQIQLGGTLA